MSALSVRGLPCDPHGTVKQIEHEELEDGDKERPSAFSEIMLKQTDSGIQELHGAGERTQYQQRKPSQSLIEAYLNPVLRGQAKGRAANMPAPAIRALIQLRNGR